MSSLNKYIFKKRRRIAPCEKVFKNKKKYSRKNFKINE